MPWIVAGMIHRMKAGPGLAAACCSSTLYVMNRRSVGHRPDGFYCGDHGGDVRTPVLQGLWRGCNGRQLVVVADHSADVQLNERWMSGPADIEC